MTSLSSDQRALSAACHGYQKHEPHLNKLHGILFLVTTLLGFGFKSEGRQSQPIHGWASNSPEHSPQSSLALGVPLEITESERSLITSGKV